MRFMEFFGVELIALGLFSWWFLTYLRSKKKRLNSEQITFVGGPLDGQKRKVHRVLPTFYERVDSDEYAVYKHDSYGVYTFVDYIHG